MVMISRSIEIDAPVEQVFSFFTKPENLLEIWPSMVEVSNARSAPDGSHSFDWVYKMGGMRFRGHSDSIEVEKNKRVVSKNEKGIPSTFEYLYEKLGNRTRLTMNVDYSLPSQLLTKIADPVLRRINENESEVVLANLKARMEHRAVAAEQPMASH